MLSEGRFVRGGEVIVGFVTVLISQVVEESLSVIVQCILWFMWGSLWYCCTMLVVLLLGAYKVSQTGLIKRLLAGNCTLGKIMNESWSSWCYVILQLKSAQWDYGTHDSHSL